MKLEMKPTVEILRRRGLQEGGRAQKLVDSEVLRYSTPHIPKRSGMLIKSGITATELGSGEVQYETPYAKYVYYGKVMVGRAPKKVTARPLRYTDAPRRGALWFERVKAERKKAILQAVARLTGGRCQ